jgi:hypothetical protein
MEEDEQEGQEESDAGLNQEVIMKRKRKRKNPVVDIAATGISLQVGSLAVGSVGNVPGARGGIASAGLSGLSLASVSLPVKGAGITLGGLKKLKGI